MNERIQELIKQAHERKPVIVADPVTFEPIHKIGNYNEPMYHNVFSPEKFAELIVRECVKIIEDEAFNNYNKYKQRHPNSFEAGHDSGMFWSVGMIKEHFGVSE